MFNIKKIFFSYNYKESHLTVQSGGSTLVLVTVSAKSGTHLPTIGY